MTHLAPRLTDQSARPRKRGWILLAVAALVPVALLSCRTVERSVVLLPNIPGAAYVGSQECEQCHEEIYKTFQTADHARLVAPGELDSFNAGCEACHGPSSHHSETGGEYKPPYSFSGGRPFADHFGAQLSTPAARATETVCFQCHGNVRGEFSLPSHHPVPEGQMTCIECHPPHKGSAHLNGGTALLAQDETCLQCHPAQRGPYVFEHEAMREGCTTCHGAHGTVNAKMLKSRNANLCLNCHFQQVSGNNILIGGSIHSGSVNRLDQGTCWTSGCHEAVHGSRVNSSLRF